ncbi:hypothetical protein F8388_013186 [Cannabis sativa]|uniref:Uncharacterized protein n=1 Tax=Cannabis sativa TaxID=3483 RepID=A0A7J6DYD6_CANSA|nr:hypothetical protein F8388_013186 [Cannabis sativa]
MANTSITKPTWLQIPDPINLLQPKYLSTPPTFPSSSSYKNRIFRVRSSSSNGSPKKSFNLKDALAGVVDERVDELMNSEENKIMLQGLEKASMRVEKIKNEIAELEKQELEAQKMREYINQLETRASEIEDCQKEISEAKAMVEEAERSLSQSEDGVISKDKERLESVKAASIAAIVGTLASLPISLTQVSTTSELILPLAITFASCALFGVTFRYTIRRDLDDVHLKTGAVAAFGVVKDSQGVSWICSGMAAADASLAALGEGQPLELNTESLLSHAFGGATFVSQNLLIFAFASIGLDYCFKARILSPFPMQKSISNTKDR